jgi:hypothetical protein
MMKRNIFSWRLFYLTKIKLLFRKPRCIYEELVSERKTFKEYNNDWIKKKEEQQWD